MKNPTESGAAFSVGLKDDGDDPSASLSGGMTYQRIKTPDVPARPIGRNDGPTHSRQDYLSAATGGELGTIRKVNGRRKSRNKRAGASIGNRPALATGQL
jgi:hypothetical protein